MSHLWEIVRSGIFAGFNPVSGVAIGLVVAAFVFRRPLPRIFGFWCGCLVFMIVWRFLIPSVHWSNRYFIVGAVMVLPAIALIARIDLLPAAVPLWLKRGVCVLSIALLLVCCIVKTGRNIAHRKDFHATVDFLKRELPKCRRPAVMVKCKEAARIEYHLGRPVFDGQLRDHLLVEMEFCRWENDVVFFLCRPKEADELRRLVPEVNGLSPVCRDERARIVIFLWRNPAWGKRKTWKREELTARLPREPGTVVEDFEETAIYSTRKTVWLRVLRERGLGLPDGEHLTMGKVFYPHHGHGWGNMQGVSFDLIVPGTPGYLAGKHTLRIMQQGSGALVATLDGRHAWRGELYFSGTPGTRLEVRYAGQSMVRAAVPEENRIYRLQWELPGGKRRFELISLSIGTGVVTLDNIRLMSEQAKDGQGIRRGP